MSAEDHPGLVYFLQAREGGPIKIGWTAAEDLKSRLHSIQVGHPYRLTVTHTIVGGRAKEHRYHIRFRAHRLNGEWFQACESVAKVAHAIPATAGDERMAAPLRAARAQAFRVGRTLGRYQGRVEGASAAFDWIALDFLDLVDFVDHYKPEEHLRKWLRSARSQGFVEGYALDVLNWPDRLESVMDEAHRALSEDASATHERVVNAARVLLRRHRRGVLERAW